MKPPCPQWVHNAVFYQIYPQTFYDSNGDGVGDIDGIIAKLDYVKSLGVAAIWLNPCFVSPMRDAGYDVADFYKVAPRYGSNATLKRLFREAGKRGLRVILDLVPGHTSIDHPWFKASASRRTTPYDNWYVWTDSTWDDGGRYASKMIHGFGERDGNYLTNFFWSQPALNFGFAKPDQPWQLPVTHPDVQRLHKELHTIMRFWFDMGAAGFRVDMAGSIIRNDPGCKECIKLWRSVREMMDRDYPDAFLVSEWSSPTTALKGGFHADFLHWFKEYFTLFWKEGYPPRKKGKEGHSFFHRDGKGDITGFLDVYLTHLHASRRHGYISIPVGNHDLPRIRYRRSRRDLEVIFAFLFTMPGVPFVYNGDEIGMKQLEGDLPTIEGCYPPRNGARTPMQWTSGRNAGFSKASSSKLYLPVDTAPSAPNVEDQERTRGSLLHTIRELVKLRSREKGLAAYADFTPLYARKNQYPFVFLRTAGEKRVLVALNPAGRAETATFSLKGRREGISQLAGNGTTVSRMGPSRVRIEMKACSFGIFKV